MATIFPKFACMQWNAPAALRSLGLALGMVMVAAQAAAAVEIAPHRALYALSLESAKPGSGVLGATGTMLYEWGEACDAWTVKQDFDLNLAYEDSDEVKLGSSMVSWESKDGLRYRFNERRTKNGELDEEIRGNARLEGADKGGKAEFTRPEAKTMTLAPRVLFPTIHTVYLIERALAGETFIQREVFDGATVDNAGLITAIVLPGGPKEKELDSPLLKGKSWRMHLAFFPSDPQADRPDYELTMRLYENGVSSEMSLDYSDYIVHATLEKIEPLQRPSC
ncbi:MAG TPA: cell envelope integrity EipB family protein [Stellaceae bacterium]|nr:cell envelope integrity EipB family protein [Stellaceae bacterium]